MKIVFKPEIQRFIDEQILAGRYQSPESVLEEALTRMMEEEASALDEALLDGIDKSEEQIERGELQKWKEVSQGLRAKYLGK